MRWDELFHDLEAQLADGETAELAGEVADRTRREIALLSLVDRARAAVGHPVRVQLLGPAAVSGRLLEVAAQWLLLRDEAGRDVLAPWTGVVSVTGLGLSSAGPEEGGPLFRRLGLTIALRAIARDRSALLHQLDIAEAGADGGGLAEGCLNNSINSPDVTGGL